MTKLVFDAPEPNRITDGTTRTHGDLGIATYSINGKEQHYRFAVDRHFDKTAMRRVWHVTDLWLIDDKGHVSSRRINVGHLKGLRDAIVQQFRARVLKYAQSHS